MRPPPPGMQRMSHWHGWKVSLDWALTVDPEGGRFFRLLPARLLELKAGQAHGERRSPEPPGRKKGRSKAWGPLKQSGGCSFEGEKWGRKEHSFSLRLRRSRCSAFDSGAESAGRCCVSA